LPAALSLAQTSDDAVASAEVAWLQARATDAAEDWKRALDLGRASGVPRTEARIAADRLERAASTLDAAERADLEERVRRWREAESDSGPDAPSSR
jgi:hypothetical protein